MTILKGRTGTKCPVSADKLLISSNRQRCPRDIPAIKCWQQTGKEFVNMGGVVHGCDTAMRSYRRTNRYRGLSEFQFCTAPDEAATTKTQLAALEFIKSIN